MAVAITFLGHAGFVLDDGEHAIPMHYGTWPLLAPSAAGFAPTGIEVRQIAPGETWRYG